MKKNTNIVDTTNLVENKNGNKNGQQTNGEGVDEEAKTGSCSVFDYFQHLFAEIEREQQNIAREQRDIASRCSKIRDDQQDIANDQRDIASRCSKIRDDQQGIAIICSKIREDQQDIEIEIGKYRSKQRIVKKSGEIADFEEVVKLPNYNRKEETNHQSENTIRKRK